MRSAKFEGIKYILFCSRLFRDKIERLVIVFSFTFLDGE